MRSLKNSRAASTDAKDERGVENSVAREIPGQSALSRRKRRGMILRQQNQIMITCKKRGEIRPCKIKDIRRRAKLSKQNQ